MVLLAGISIVLVRASARARDDAESKLREINLTLESTVDERTADLREANEEIQRFAYIVSHDLRSPLVNIMGFTSELDELRNDIFRRIATLARAATDLPPPAEGTTPELEGADKQLATDFSEALGFIKSSIAKMDRLISAILNLTREGRREFCPCGSRPASSSRPLFDPRASGCRGQCDDSDRAAAHACQRPPGVGADLLQFGR